jgi:hypothetical protein
VLFANATTDTKTTARRGAADNKGFGKSGAEVLTMSICNSIWLLFQLDVILFSFLLLPSTFVTILSFGSRLTEY